MSTTTSQSETVVERQPMPESAHTADANADIQEPDSPARQVPAALAKFRAMREQAGAPPIPTAKPKKKRSRKRNEGKQNEERRKTSPVHNGRTIDWVKVFQTGVPIDHLFKGVMDNLEEFSSEQLTQLQDKGIAILESRATAPVEESDASEVSNVIADATSDGAVMIRDLASQMGIEPHVLCLDVFEAYDETMVNANMAVHSHVAEALCAKHGFDFDYDEPEEPADSVEAFTPAVDAEALLEEGEALTPEGDIVPTDEVEMTEVAVEEEQEEETLSDIIDEAPPEPTLSPVESVHLMQESVLRFFSEERGLDNCEVQEFSPVTVTDVEDRVGMTDVSAVKDDADGYAGDVIFTVLVEDIKLGELFLMGRWTGTDLSMTCRGHESNGSIPVSIAMQGTDALEIYQGFAEKMRKLF